MNQQELFIKWNGKFNNFDNGFGAQCVDIVKQYFADVLNMPTFQGNAIDYWNKEVPGFNKIKNSAFSYPKPGDLIVWNIGEFGHIGICNWVRTFDLNVFEQNNPIGAPCGFKTYNYKNILGWLRPIPNLNGPKEWPVLYAGLNQPDLSGFEANIKKYTNNMLSIKAKSIPNQIQGITVGMPTYEQSIAFLDAQNTNGIKSVFIFYPANSTSAYFSASYYPKKNISFVTCPLPGSTEVYTHEFLHLFRKWINSNHLGFIEDVEYYPPNWRFPEQYAQLLPILPKL